MRTTSWFGSRHAWIAGIDTVLLFAFLALQEPGGATGFVWHEWVGLAFIPLFVVHVVLSWSWIVTTWGRIWSEPASRARINYLMNAALFVMMTVVVVSGLVISEYALPAAGISTHATERWERLHNSTSSLLTVVVALHVALNWSWITRALRRYLSPSRQKPRHREDVT